MLGAVRQLTKGLLGYDDPVRTRARQTGWGTRSSSAESASISMSALTQNVKVSKRTGSRTISGISMTAYHCTWRSIHCPITSARRGI